MNSCSFVPKNSKTNDSTKEDAIVACALHDVTGLIPFISTFKATRSKASLIILTDDEAYDKIKESHLENDAHYINVKSMPFLKGWGGYTYKLTTFDFVAAFGDEFKRVMIVDTNDIIFQSDPFHKDYKIDKIVMTFELVSLDHNFIHLVWEKKYLNWKLIRDYSVEAINSGCLVGRGKKMKDFCRLSMEILGKDNPPDSINEQVVIQYLLMNHFYDDGGFEIETRGRNHFTYYASVLGNAELPFPETCMVNSDEVASMVHKYFRVLWTKERIIWKCQMMSNVVLFRNSPSNAVLIDRYHRDTLNIDNTVVY